MTKERKIEILKDLLVQLSDSANILCTCEADERCEVVEEYIKALEQQPAKEDVQRVVDYLLKPNSKSITFDDCVSLGVYKQVAWERDIAIEQLKELGYEFGEKIRTSDDCVSIAELEKWLDLNFSFGGACRKLELFDRLEKELPRVTPTHGTCKDCFYYNIDEDGHGYHCEKYEHTRFPVYANFYCADFEKRGAENG